MLEGVEVYPAVVVYPVPNAGPEATPNAGGDAGIVPVAPKGMVLRREPLGENLGAEENPSVPRLVARPPTASPWVNITPKLDLQTVFGSLWKARPMRGPKFL